MMVVGDGGGGDLSGAFWVTADLGGGGLEWDLGSGCCRAPATASSSTQAQAQVGIIILDLDRSVPSEAVEGQASQGD